MKIERELISAVIVARAFIHIRHVQIADAGYDMGGQMWFEAMHRRWVTDNLQACLDTYAFARIEIRGGADNLGIHESGHEQTPVINLRNRRLDVSEHGGTYVLMMSRPIAAQLARALRALD